MGGWAWFWGKRMVKNGSKKAPGFESVTLVSGSPELIGVEVEHSAPIDRCSGPVRREEAGSGLSRSLPCVGLSFRAAHWARDARLRYVHQYFGV